MRVLSEMLAMLPSNPKSTQQPLSREECSLASKHSPDRNNAICVSDRPWPLPSWS